MIILARRIRETAVSVSTASPMVMKGCKVAAAKWGREHLRDWRRSRAPVIVLTAYELFAPDSLNDAWDKRGGKHKVFAKKGMIQMENLRVLANLKQQLYLNLPPYDK